MKALMKRVHRPIHDSRVRKLAEAILPEVRAGDRLLDVGCGDGALLDVIVKDPACPPCVVAHGLERAPRGGEPIPMTAYSGGRIPFDDGAFDLVILADVLHHEQHELDLLRECARVAKRAVILKDHAREGLLAQARISFMDWAANAPYGVPCLYRYHTLQEWHEILTGMGLKVVREIHPMKLYPAGWELVFDGRLQYFAVLHKMD